MPDDVQSMPVQITTRVPPEIADTLMEIAQEERRSLSNLLVLAIEQYIDQRQARKDAA